MLARLKASTSKCGALHCNEVIPRGKLMCRAHWLALPRHLREEISSAWKQRRVAHWSANVLEARVFLAPKITRSAEICDRLLGEG
jgi:hypothetical protein